MLRLDSMRMCALFESRFIETYTDAYLQEDLPVPRHVSKWHGYIMPMTYVHPQKNYATTIDSQRKKTWCRLTSTIHRRHESWSFNMHERSIVNGRIRSQDCRRNQAGAQGSGVVCRTVKYWEWRNSLSIQLSWLMKNRFGMAAWTETLVPYCGVECTNVLFETGFRRRDPAYDDGGKPGMFVVHFDWMASLTQSRYRYRLVHTLIVRLCRWKFRRLSCGHYVSSRF